MNLDELTLEEVVAEALVPRCLDSYETTAPPSEHERLEARRMVNVMREVLRRRPALLAEFGWQCSETRIVPDPPAFREGTIRVWTEPTI